MYSIKKNSSIFRIIENILFVIVGVFIVGRIMIRVDFIIVIIDFI